MTHGVAAHFIRQGNATRIWVFVGLQFSAPGSGQRPSILVAGGKPLVPGDRPLQDRLDILPVVPEVAFIDHREPAKRRFIGPAFARIRAHMLQQLAREVLPIPKGRFVHRHENLELIHRDCALGHLHLLCPDRTRNVQVRRYVDAALGACGHQIVKLVQRLRLPAKPRLAIGQRALIVMDADRIVPQANQAIAKPIHLLPRQVQGAKAEVHSIETLGLIRCLFKGKVAIGGNNHSAILAGRSFGKSHPRKVQR